jgi:predicted ATPase
LKTDPQGRDSVRLTKLYVRFFRSFNYDYERKVSGAKPVEWELIAGEGWFPFVRVDLDPVVTAVVGANESGKSLLLEALEQALTGERIDHRDFCRYSTLFSVEVEEIRSPDLGVEMEVVGDEDVELLAELGLESDDAGRIRLFRFEEGRRTVVVLPNGETVEVNPEKMLRLQQSFPSPFTLETDVPIPDSVSLDDLLGGVSTRLRRRRDRAGLFDLLAGFGEDPATEVSQRASEIAAFLENNEADTGLTEVDLGRKLLIDVARISEQSIRDLLKALRDGDEGTVGGIVNRMNKALATHLNFNRWWRQDREFQLRVSPRERDLVFTIRDRTGTDYSFEERSKGLRYFLSYYVQLLAHRGKQTPRPEILLMDEPDAYLSAMGQQDLLRVLEEFARPEGTSREDQVLYVTHSPFLINRNAAHRIRVLDKGSNEEGTRVVRDVARTHYEPLRSSLGAYVAETAFIGGSNLIVEGLSDQVMLAALSNLLRARGLAASAVLDLNEVTIVPAGSAASVPYIAYLARGRDQIRPACVALLDGDGPGLEAVKKLKRSDDGARKPVLADEDILNLGEWEDASKLELEDGVVLREPEDLIPCPVLAEVARRYAIQFLGISAEEAGELDAEKVRAKLAKAEGSAWDALQLAFGETFDGGHIEKVGFSKELAHLVEANAAAKPRPHGFPVLEANFEILIAELSRRLRRAQAVEQDRRSRNRTRQIVEGFLGDRPTGASRDAARELIHEIEGALEDTYGDEEVRRQLNIMFREFELGIDPEAPVPRYEEFQDALRSLDAVRREAYRNRTESLVGEKTQRNSKRTESKSKNPSG